MDLGVMASAVSGCGGKSGTWGPWMEGENVSAFGQIHPDRVVSRSVATVILGEFGTKAPSLYADHRVDLGIEIILSAKYFSGDLIFLEWSAWMIEGVFGDITKKFAKGLRTVQDGAAGQLLYFSLD